MARKRRFADGLAALERAVALCPGDAAILYTLGWCREFVAHALERPRQPHQPVAQDAPTLYAATNDILRRALTLDPTHSCAATSRTSLTSSPTPPASRGTRRSKGASEPGNG